MSMAVRDIVADAVDALHHFGDDLTRDDADKLLSMWRDRRLLNPEQRRAVLDAIEPERGQVAQVDYLPAESPKCEHIRPCWDIDCRAGGV